MSEFKGEENYLIRVIGIDNKQHLAHPWEDQCKCGVKIKRKKVLEKDWQLPSCYKCTY